MNQVLQSSSYHFLPFFKFITTARVEFEKFTFLAVFGSQKNCKIFYCCKTIILSVLVKSTRLSCLLEPYDVMEFSSRL